MVVERHGAGHGMLVVVGMSDAQTEWFGTRWMKEIKVDAFES
jgi:hypothetical protein